MIRESHKMIHYIDSLQNPTFKNWKKLLTNKGRKQQQQYLIEGFHLVEEAIKHNALESCIITQSLFEKYQALLSPHQTYIVPEKLIKELSTTINSQNIFGVVKFNIKALAQINSGKYIILDALQDPGNVGTIIRTADAAGFSGVIIGDNCVDIYNDKTIRSMQGSQFHINLFKENLLEVIPLLKHKMITILGTNLDKNSQLYHQIKWNENFAIIVGNEGNGVSKAVLNLCDATVHIPIFGQAESLNVAIAASILMYHSIKN